MRRLLFVVFAVLIFSNKSSAQEYRITRGGVTDSLPIAGNSETYALYTPSNYIPEKQWPVIFVIDAEGRGLVPVDY